MLIALLVLLAVLIVPVVLQLLFGRFLLRPIAAAPVLVLVVGLLLFAVLFGILFVARLRIVLLRQPLLVQRGEINRNAQAGRKRWKCLAIFAAPLLGRRRRWWTLHAARRRTVRILLLFECRTFGFDRRRWWRRIFALLWPSIFRSARRGFLALHRWFVQITRISRVLRTQRSLRSLVDLLLLAGRSTFALVLLALLLATIAFVAVRRR